MESGSDTPTDTAVTRAEFEALRAQVAALAEQRPVPATAQSPGNELWALEGLRDRLEETAGGVVFAGSVELDDVPHAWQQGATTASVLATDWSHLAPTLDALGHPVRLLLLQSVASGIRRTADLAKVETIGTSGQLHHHLRLLVAAGWLRSASRGAYEIPATRVVPLLVVLTAAER